MTPTKLLEPFVLAGQALKNRMVMAPMTRTRASSAGVLGPLNALYYRQRASAGLIVSECTQISEQAHGVIRAPGIHTQEQISGWRQVADTVHAAGGVLYMQVWHCGRVSHTAIRQDRTLPVAPSPIAATGKFFTPSGLQDFEVPRELGLGEIASIVEDFRQAAVNAKKADVDGVELHGAFGYLVDQFLQDGTNKRTDAYGGSLENRCRFLFQVVDALTSVWGPSKVGVKLSPANRFYGMFDSNALATFSYALRGLSQRRIGYVHMMEPSPQDLAAGNVLTDTTKTFRPLFTGVMIGNGGFTAAKANEFITAGACELVSFGSAFLANPDLPKRFELGAPLNAGQHQTFYGEGSGGYTDYPFLAPSSTGDQLQLQV